MSLALNFERKCRTCGTDILELTCGIPIFGSGLQLDHKIHRYLGLNISLHDDLPKFLCATCFIKVESIDKFAILAKKTEEAYLGWFKCIRANLAKHISPLPPPLAPVRQLVTTSGTGSPKPSGLSITPKLDFSALKQAVNDQINQSDAPLGSALNPIRLIKPEISIVSYSDLKLGLLIKDQELLKLILKALRWAEHDQKASFETLIQRLKNTTFREILSNPNLLKDSDLTQLLKSYIGQEAFNKFTSGNGNSSNDNIDLGNRGVTIKPIVHILPVKASSNQLDKGTASCSKGISIVKKENMQLNEDSVTKMEVGVDPCLYLDDEDSQGKSKKEADQKAENVVTIRLVPANVSTKKPEEQISPVTFGCSSCSETFTTGAELQNHITAKHLVKSIELASETPVDKKVIKIRVKKTRDKAQTVPSPAPISLPLPIPPSTTITVIPSVTSADPKPEKENSAGMNQKAVITAEDKPKEKKPTKVNPAEKKPDLVKPPEVKSAASDADHTQPTVPLLNLQKPTEPSKAQSDKSKRKREVKWTLKIGSNPAKRTRSQVNMAKGQVKTTCSICKKRFPSKTKLASHIETHNNAPAKYTCDKCDRTFRTSSNLAKHKQLHGGEKFACDRCRKVYPTSSMLKAHKIVHSDERPYRCTICDKTFKRNQDLKFHLNQHTGSRPFKCPQCPKSFASSGNCFSHRKRMHPSDPVGCEKEGQASHKPDKKQ